MPDAAEPGAGVVGAGAADGADELEPADAEGAAGVAVGEEPTGGCEGDAGDEPTGDWEGDAGEPLS